MDCILFRHGIAADRDAWAGADGDRPLVPRGVEKTRKAAAGLRRLEVSPDLILSSPFTRALETARIVQEALRHRKDVKLCDELLSDAPPDKLLVLLNALPPDSTVICVGHEPHLGMTAGLMVCGRAVDGLSVKKSGGCLITFDGPPRAGEGSLRWWLPPGVLRALKRT